MHNILAERGGPFRCDARQLLAVQLSSKHLEVLLIDVACSGNQPTFFMMRAATPSLGTLAWPSSICRGTHRHGLAWTMVRLIQPGHVCLPAGHVHGVCGFYLGLSWCLLSCSLLLAETDWMDVSVTVKYCLVITANLP